MTERDPYKENGYANRDEYLRDLADEFGVDAEGVVFIMADILGPDEDFDALITTLEDEADNFKF